MSARPLLLAAALFSVTACTPSEDTPPSEAPAADEAGVVEIVARGLTLEIPSEVPSGWTTLRFRNESQMVHFAVLEKMPDGHGLVSQQEEVAPVFQEGFELLASGEVEAAMGRFGELPEWFGQIVFMGGPGLTGPGVVSEATVHLEPGTYLVECYIKTGGVFHSYNPDPALYGMVAEFTVTEASSGRSEPEADVSVSVSSTAGFTMDGIPTAGRTTFRVEFTDQIVHENFVGHDVHVARLDSGADPSVLEAWMDWSRPEGLQTPAPFVFVGGLNEMPAGKTGYFTVDLTPGDYALVAEVPGTQAKGMLQRFTVEQ